MTISPRANRLIGSRRRSLSSTVIPWTGISTFFVGTPSASKEDVSSTRGFFLPETTLRYDGFGVWPIVSPIGVFLVFSPENIKIYRKTPILSMDLFLSFDEDYDFAMHVLVWSGVGERFADHGIARLFCGLDWIYGKCSVWRDKVRPDSDKTAANRLHCG